MVIKKPTTRLNVIPLRLFTRNFLMMCDLLWGYFCGSGSSQFGQKRTSAVEILTVPRVT